MGRARQYTMLWRGEAPSRAPSAGPEVSPTGRRPPPNYLACDPTALKRGTTVRGRVDGLRPPPSSQRRFGGLKGQDACLHDVRARMAGVAVRRLRSTRLSHFWRLPTPSSLVSVGASAFAFALGPGGYWRQPDICGRSGWGDSPTGIFWRNRPDANSATFGRIRPSLGRFRIILIDVGQSRGAFDKFRAKLDNSRATSLAESSSLHRKVEFAGRDCGFAPREIVSAPSGGARLQIRPRLKPPRARSTAHVYVQFRYLDWVRDIRRRNQHVPPVVGGGCGGARC